MAAFTLAVILLGLLVVQARFWPYGPCPWCHRRRGRGPGSTRRAFSRCRHCDNGVRVRPLAQIWPRHRRQAAADAARRRKQRNTP